MNARSKTKSIQFYLQLLLLVSFMIGLTAKEGRCQMMIGDPSLTLGVAGAVKVEVGTGSSMDQKIKTDRTTLNISANPNVITTVNESEDKLGSDQYFLKLTAGLGKFGDVFGSIGQARITKFIDGSFGTLVGGGVKLSPP
jgi:hypothetical protein